jgi:hypothetical protein
MENLEWRMENVENGAGSFCILHSRFTILHSTRRGSPILVFLEELHSIALVSLAINPKKRKRRDMFLVSLASRNAPAYNASRLPPHACCSAGIAWLTPIG